jgi:hypothetical protein
MDLSAGKEEDSNMTASAQLLYPPVVRAAHLPARGFGLPRRQARPPQNRAQRVYRLPRQEPRGNRYYYWNGYASPEPVNGTLIDLYA